MGTPLEIAHDPTTPSPELERLSLHRSRAVREAVAKNPNTSVDVLKISARTFPDSVCINPLLDWLLLEDANWLASFDATARHRLLMEPSVDSGILWWAARFGSADDQLAAAQNASCPVEVLTHLIEFGLPEVVLAAKTHWKTAAAASDPYATSNTHASSMDSTSPDISSTDTDRLRVSLRNGSSEATDIASLIEVGAVPASLFELLVDGDVQVRRAIARSPKTTANTLTRLIVDDDDETRAFARRHQAVPAQLLETLVALEAADLTADLASVQGVPLSAYLQMALARHPKCDPEIQRAMVTDTNWRLREAVASNAALSVESFVRLAADGDKDVRVAVASNPSLPRFLARLLQHDRVDEVASIASTLLEQSEATDIPPTSQTPVSNDGLELLMDLEKHDFGIGVLLARHPQVSAEVLRKLCDGNDWRVRQSCAASVLAPTDVLDRLLRDADADVRMAAIANPCTSFEMVKNSADSTHGDVRRRLVQESTDPSYLEASATDSANMVREAVAVHPSAPLAAIRILAGDSESSIRHLVAVREDLSDELVGILASDADATVQQRIAARDKLPNDAILALFQDTRKLHNEKRAYQCRELLRGHSLSQRNDAALLRNAPSWLRQQVVRATTNAKLLALLAKSEDWYTRVAVAEHACVTGPILRLLSTDGDHDVRTAIAKTHRMLPPDVIRSLAIDPHSSVRSAILERHEVTADLLDTMLFDDDDTVRTRVLNNPLLSQESRELHRRLADASPLDIGSLRKLADASSVSRQLVAQHPSTTPALLRHLSYDENWRVREDLARNPRCTPSTQHRLREDSDRDVRRSLASNVAITTEVLLALLTDDDESVRLAAGRNSRLPHAQRDRFVAASVRRLTKSTSAIDRLVVISSDQCDVRELRRRRNWQALHWEIRLAVAQNLRAPREILLRLANDANRVVRAQAIARLAMIAQ